MHTNVESLGWGGDSARNGGGCGVGVGQGWFIRRIVHIYIVEFTIRVCRNLYGLTKAEIFINTLLSILLYR